MIKLILKKILSIIVLHIEWFVFCFILNLLLSMFLGPGIVAIIATVIFIPFTVYNTMKKRFCKGDLKREFIKEGADRFSFKEEISKISKTDHFRAELATIGVYALTVLFLSALKIKNLKSFIGIIIAILLICAIICVIDLGCWMFVRYEWFTERADVIGSSEHGRNKD